MPSSIQILENPKPPQPFETLAAEGLRKQDTISNLTGVRGFAAIWVLLYHFFDGWNFPVISRGYLGVDVFFVLSGLVLSLVYATGLPSGFNLPWYKRFISRRFAKIYPMHLLTFAATAMLILAGHLVKYHFVTTNVENTAWSATCSLLMIHALGFTKYLSWNSDSWSISAEWFAYAVLFAPMMFVFRRMRIAWVVLIAFLLWSALMVAFAFLFPGGIGQITTNGVLRILPEFTAGYLLYRFVQGRRSSRGDLFTLAGIILLVAVALAQLRFTFLLLPAIMLLLTGLYFGGRLTNLIFSNGPIVKLGEASYSIYLVQGLVHIAAGVTEGRFGRNIRHSLVGSAMASICAVLIGVLAFHLFEEPARLKLLRVLNPRFSTKDQPSSSSPMMAEARQ